MALDDMLRVLEEEGKKQREEVLAQGEERAAKILEEARVEAERIKQEEMDKVAISLQGEKAKILNDARLYVKRRVIQTKEDFIQKAFSATREELLKFRNSKDYPQVFRRLLTEAVENADGKVVVHVNKEDEKLARQVLDQMGVAYQLHSNMSSLGGVKVTTADERITLVNTLEARLEKAKQHLKSEVMATLFD